MSQLGAAGIFVSLLQIVVVVAGAPLLIGMMRQVRARLEGRAGTGVLQPWRDLRKLLGKQPISPAGTSIVFRLAPLVLMATTLAVVAVAPFVSTAAVPRAGVDLFVVVGLLALGAVWLVLAGIDTGTAFGGMGASREMTVLALVEPTLLVAIFALSVPVGSTNLADIITSTVGEPAEVLTPGGLLAAVALGIAVIAETGRLPVDNPSTHLELTMIHEAMVLEYSGPDLAVVELSSWMRLSVFLGLWSSLFMPWGVAVSAAPLALLVGVLVFAAKVGLLAVLLAISEVFFAKLRLFRVPELLAGSFLLALLAVASSYLLT